MAQSIILKQGGRCSLPLRVVFVACEPRVTVGQNGRGCCIHSFREGYTTVCTLSDGELTEKCSLSFAKTWLFWLALEETRDSSRCTWVFGHNIGYHLRLLGFWDWLPASGSELVSCVLEDPPTIITVRLGRRLIKFVDVLNYWRLSLSDLSVGCGHSGAETVQRSGRQYTDPWPARKNVEVIESCMLRLINLLAETGYCSLRTTAASLAWGAYLKCFLPRPLSLSLDKRARSLERRAYFGGRVQAFASGSIKEHVTGLDCNSLYPSVMKDHLYPCRLVAHPHGLRTAELKSALRYYDAVASVDLYPGEYPYPARTASGVDFVRGIGSAVLAGDELRLACDRCDVKRVKDIYLYDRDDLFSGFVKHFYTKKQLATAAGNRADVMLYKMILNSLHGKFGQKGRRWSPAPEIVARGYYDYWFHKRATDATPVRVRAVAGRVETREFGSDPRHSFPAVSAAITANARVVLEYDIRSAGPHNVLYCDTDSIHTLLPGYQRLDRLGRLDKTALGAYRSVVSGDSAFYYGRQYYRIGEHTVCSSLKPTAQEISDGIYLQDAYQGIESSLETGDYNRVAVAQRVIDMNGRSRCAKKIFATT